MVEPNKRKSPVGPFRPQLQLCLAVFHGNTAFTGKLRATGKSGSAMVCRCGYNCPNLFSKHLFRISCMPDRALASGIQGTNCGTVKELPFDDGTRQMWLRHGRVCARGQRTESISLTSQEVLMCMDTHRGARWWPYGEAMRHTEAQNFPPVWYNVLHTHNVRTGVGLGKKGLCQNTGKGCMHGDPRNHTYKTTA